eukprot:scaffold3105_cov135-Skeletonema_dohrnii-CCMP3373.AAC.3
MVSRKKAKGKARKAVKAKKEEEKEAHDESSAAAAQRREQDGALEAQLQMQPLLIDSLVSPCQHGFIPIPKGHICDLFLKLYFSTYSKGLREDSAADSILEAMAALDKKYPEVLYDSSKMKHILSYFLSVGTHRILNGDDDAARVTAVRIIMFEEFLAVRVHKTKAGVQQQKLLEMFTSDDHTLVSFFRKRISCTCLDKKHNEVKSIKKMGLCNNDQCPLPGLKVERSKMLYCTRCRDAYYCSRDCQEAAWRGHNKSCTKTAEQNAKFEQEMRMNHNVV